MATYGVILTIPEPWGSQLHAARAGFGDPLAALVPPHITILPPTEIAEEDLAAFEDHLAAVCADNDPFEVALRGTGTFRPVSPVVFVQVSRGIGCCERLERAVRSGPVLRELEFNYHPHVTVAHHLDDATLDRAYAELADFGCTFTAGSLDLYEQGADCVWQPVRSHPLGEARRLPR